MSWTAGKTCLATTAFVNFTLWTENVCNNVFYPQSNLQHICTTWTTLCNIWQNPLVKAWPWHNKGKLQRCVHFDDSQRQALDNSTHFCSQVCESIISDKTCSADLRSQPSTSVTGYETGSGLREKLRINGVVYIPPRRHNSVPRQSRYFHYKDTSIQAGIHSNFGVRYNKKKICVLFVYYNKKQI